MLEMKLIASFQPFATFFNLFFVLMLANVFVSGYEAPANNSRRIAKRNELDIQFCVENFDIQEDTIIRTQDSRAMGAKYINETDLSSREECLKLCCETTSCDVFVFEEKNPGSCYLFNCGPSDDFKCKFTQHRHYTSAILTISRHAAELENEMQHSKHEQELTRLRISGSELIPSTPSSPVIVTTAPPPPKEPSHPALPVNTTIAKPGTRGVSRESVAYGGGEGAVSEGTTREKCSRYQFECRSTGECIAIYNACDGIPQCADGSDEGSELDCPSSSTSPQIHPIQNPDNKPHPHNHPHTQPKAATVTTAGTHAVTSPPLPQLPQQALPRHLPPVMENYQGGRGQHNLQSSSVSMHQIPPQLQPFQPNWPQQQQQQLQNQYHSMGNINGGYSPDAGENRPQYPPQHLQQQSHIGYPGEDFPMAAGQPERPPMSSGNQWPPFRPGSPSLPSPLGQDWFPHPPMDGGNVGQQYEENGPNRHIFNHKGSGLVADTDRYFHMRSHPFQYNIPNYGDGTQGDYNPYTNVDGKGYAGGNENYFNTPYRQPVQPNWPLMHQQMASNSDPHQMTDNVKDLQEEAVRKHAAAANQGLVPPNLPHGDYPPSLQSGSDRRPGSLPLPPDYFYEDGPGGRHVAVSPNHRGNNYQRVNAGGPLQNQGPLQQKPNAVHRENPPVVHAKGKASASKGKVEEGEEEGEEMGEEKEEENEEEETNESHSEKKPLHSKANVTPKPAALKQAETLHQKPVHMSVKHDGSSMNNEGNSDVPDGESSRPKGAILSLTLGMGITAIMVALMAWRLRVIKRRLRRGGGKSPYAHDADYLVNGMYL